MVMYAGHIVESGPTEDVLADPKHPYTQLLLSAVPDPRAPLAVDASTDRGEPPRVIDPGQGCRFRWRCPFAIEAVRGRSPRCHGLLGAAAHRGLPRGQRRRRHCPQTPLEQERTACEDRRHRRRQHLHARAHRGLRPPGRRARPSTSWCCTTSPPSGSTSSADSPAGSWPEQGFAGRLAHHDRRSTPRSTAPPRCSSSCGSAARRPAWSTRRCRTSSGCSARRPPGRAASPRRLRTVPVVLDIADVVRRRARPGAWIVDFTNPVGIVTRALLDEGHRALGPVQRGDRLPAAAGRPVRRRRRPGPPRPRRAQPPVLDPPGARRRRRPAAGAARRSDAADELAGATEMPVELLRTLGAIPSLLPALLLLHRPRAYRPRRSGRHRARGGAARSSAHCSRCTPTRPSTTSRRCSKQRGGAYYSEAAAALVTSLLTGDGAHHYVDVRNDGHHRRPARRGGRRGTGALSTSAGAHPVAGRAARAGACSAWSRRSPRTRS